MYHNKIKEDHTLKKRILIFFVVLLIISTSTVYAENGVSLTVIEYDEITDLDLLRERAKNGITHASIPFQMSSVLVLLEDPEMKNGKVKSVKREFPVYVTTQKLKTIKGKDFVEETFATTAFTTASTYTYQSYSKSSSTRDSGDTVESYGTIYYTIRKCSDCLQSSEDVKLNRAKGGWYDLDTHVSLSNREVEYGVLQGPDGSDTVFAYPTTNTFDYTSNSKYQSNGDITYAGMVTVVTLTEGSNTWQHRFQLDHK